MITYKIFITKNPGKYIFNSRSTLFSEVLSPTSQQSQQILINGRSLKEEAS